MATNLTLSPRMIRTFLLDRCAADNFLLDEVEMDDEMLDLAMLLTVDRYNNTTPILDEGYTPYSFPYVGEMLLGITAHLLRSKGLNLQRNALALTSTSGTAVDDKGAKSRVYLDLSEKYFQQFEDRIKPLKMNVNVQGGFGFVL